jgi:hypothetical protein
LAPTWQNQHLEKAMSGDCERFEVEIGRRQHGDLPADEAAALDAHLASCASCRRFAASGHHYEEALARRAQAEARQVSWEAVWGRVRKLHRNYRLKLWLAPLFLLQLPLASLAAKGTLPPPWLLAVVAPMNVALYFGYVWLVNWPLRRLLAAARSGQDLVAGYERELRRRRLRAYVFAAVNGLIAIACLYPALTAPGLQLRLYGLGCVLLFGGWAAHDLFRRLPRLRAALIEVRR